MLVLVFPTSTTAFSVISLLSTSVSRTPLLFQAAASPAAADAASDDSSKDSHNSASLSRRSLFQSVAVTSSGMLLSTMVPSVAPAAAAAAAQRVPLENSLYTILRVREATQQEARLIKTGKFKDVQRANVKLAVKFLIENYSLNDAFVAASTYLDGNDKRMAAVNVGQNAVQDLYTILEYFDASDVQNLKVRSFGFGLVWLGRMYGCDASFFCSLYDYFILFLTQPVPLDMENKCLALDKITNAL